MANEDSSKREPKKPMVDLSKFYPKIEYGGVTYGSRVTSMGVGRDLSQELVRNPELSAPEFARLLLGKSLYPEDGDDLIDEVKAGELAKDPAFLEKVIEVHRELYSEFVKDDDDPKKRLAKLCLERKQDESAADYLFRAYRDRLDRQLEQMRESMEKIQRQFAGLSGSLSASGFDSLLASTSASRRIDDIIKGSVGSDRIAEFMKGSSGRDRISDILKGSGTDKIAEAMKRANDVISGRGIEADTFQPPRPYTLPPIPPNPIHETNATLAEVASSIDEMRDLFAQQAVMQSSLNEVATEILDKFVTGAQNAEKSSKRALMIAMIAIAASILPVIYSEIFDNKDQAMLIKQAEIVTVMKGVREDARHDARNNALIDQEQHQQLTNVLKKLEPKLLSPVPKPK
jgi:uncharacterized protein YukE